MCARTSLRVRAAAAAIHSAPNRSEDARRAHTHTSWPKRTAIAAAVITSIASARTLNVVFIRLRICMCAPHTTCVRILCQHNGEHVINIPHAITAAAATTTRREVQQNRRGSSRFIRLETKGAHKRRSARSRLSGDGGENRSSDRVCVCV